MSNPSPYSSRPISRDTNMATSPPTTSSSTKDAHLRTPSSPHLVSHRQSFHEHLRGMPSSPRAHRQPSLSQQQFQELINNPPIGHAEDTHFKGRDWRSVKAGEVIDGKEVRFVSLNTSVEDATNLLISSGAPNVVLVEEGGDGRKDEAITTFDYNDLNAYLLLVVGAAKPEQHQISLFAEISRMAQAGESIPLSMVKDLGRKEPLVKLPAHAPLTRVVELFGSGLHRVVITEESSEQVVGIISQLRLVRFFWEHGRNFREIEALYQQRLRDLALGSKSVYAVNGDKPLIEALQLMHHESITSLPILDASANVVGNISHVDVKLLTKTTSLPLLQQSCLHFISVILSERGLEGDGKDPWPVFHVNPMSTLAHTVAKLVATRSHRMWIVDEPSPGSSGPPTPSLSAASLHINPLHMSGSNPGIANPTAIVPGTPSHTSSLHASTSTLTSASTTSMSGRLTGVVSLTDILNLFAKASGLRPHDPDETRRQRRRSSSSSFRRSMDSDSRSEREGSAGVGRNTSIGGRR